jgi:hypothetical protein
MSEETNFSKLAAIDVSAHLEKKQTGSTTLSYLSWAWAWDYFKKAYPDAKYEIKEWEGKPYLFDEKTGYMVETSITAGGETHIMWLPVMDGANHAMTDKPYQITTKYKTVDVNAANMFDINKTIMRCLVKNMAMFGLGLYIYAGEDLPEAVETATQTPKITKKAAFVDPKHLALLNSAKTLEELDASVEKIKAELGDTFKDVRSLYVPIYKKREKELAK